MIFDEIHTIDARTFLLLEVLTDHLDLNQKQVFSLIRDSFSELLGALEKKYSSLRSALVPSTTRGEWAFLFDWERAASAAYGREAMHALLPLLSTEGSHSVLCGDWARAEPLSRWVSASPELEIDPTLAHAANDGATLYIIYVNNLPEASARRISTGLRECSSYVGALDLTYMSAVKAGLARQLVRAFVKHRDVIIQPHEDDRSVDEDIDISLFDFESFELVIRSVPSSLYSLFLSFKIESPPLPGERDNFFALNAISDSPIALSECEVEVEERKLQYLLEQKAGSLKRAGFRAPTVLEVGTKIKEKLDSNYIYSLARAPNGEVLKFNVTLEITPSVRSLVSLEYIPAKRRMRVITFY